ncbi:MAG: DUF4783 domain-containing protein [Bacteroidales bacterium]|nr:DUF4783 domain-containing protein [Bacteroidales bacterium]
MKALLRTAIVAIALLAGVSARAQSGEGDVFVPISKYLSQGNTEALSAWFSENLDVTVLGKSGISSSKQAKQILSSFFSSHTPRSFKVTYTAGRANMKYALGDLSAGGETFLVTVFVSFKDDAYRIQQLKIERVQ